MEAHWPTHIEAVIMEAQFGHGVGSGIEVVAGRSHPLPLPVLGSMARDQKTDESMVGKLSTSPPALRPTEKKEEERQ